MKVFIMTTVMAPYRVDLFNEIGKFCDLHVCFEQKHDIGRNDKWYNNAAKNFKLITLKKWDKSLKYIKLEIIKYIRKENIDIAVAYEYSTITSMLFMQFCIMKNIPYLINCDGAFIKRNILKDRIKKYFISHSAACLANGKHAEKYFLHYGANKKNIFTHEFSSLHESEILKIMMSDKEKSKMKKKLNLEDKVTVISIGQFIERKGFDVLIKAWKNINSNYNLLIIGGGEKKKEYEEQIKNLNLKNIKIIDFMRKKELDDFYMASDLFVLPTREDVWGLVINEAMALGLPIITTDKCIAGLELVEKDVNGFIVPVDDEIELANKINVVLNNIDIKHKMGKSSLEKIKPYTIEKCAQKHLSVFRKVR
ncbi:glycosyltransferase family 4 protein [Paraclostridium bifermentans]|uniref:glycosyltransferase family 4 protein n=1 Tax=Paraclostridium bifermentans TaxID=1490 RepID=UPI001FF5921B|nr:glycosyltransferase family 4 protein [Paraclostridium bifermentans]UOW67243.1 glycosyltransferase family 4 protein [Paraclostridium bifermentans]